MSRNCLIVLLFVCAISSFAESGVRPESGGSSISGTVVDVNDGVVPGASIVLRCQSQCKGESTIACGTGAFEFTNLSLGTSYEIAVSANGFRGWTSSPIVLTPEHSMYLLTDARMVMDDAAESVTVCASPEQIATEQVHIEEQQRALGIIPNFYVVYDSKNAVPLSTKLKFQMAMKVSVCSRPE